MKRLTGKPGVSQLYLHKILTCRVYADKKPTCVCLEKFVVCLECETKKLDIQFGLISCEALTEFWSHEKSTEWYQRHPVFQAALLQQSVSIGIEHTCS